jgi:hypothetical protein
MVSAATGKSRTVLTKEDSSEKEREDQVSCLSVPRVESQTQENNMSFRVQYTHLVEYSNDNVYIILYFIGGYSPFFVRNKDEKNAWMVESTPSVVYDAIEVYQQEGLSETSGHVMLLQAETSKKKQAAK